MRLAEPSLFEDPPQAVANDPPSSLRRPPAKYLRLYHHGQIGKDEIRDYLEAGFSLAFCCRDCMRLGEWTPPELVRRYGDRLSLPIVEIARRLTCGGQAGCGSHDVAVFAHLFDGAWRWPPSA